VIAPTVFDVFVALPAVFREAVQCLEDCLADGLPLLQQSYDRYQADLDVQTRYQVQVLLADSLLDAGQFTEAFEWLAYLKQTAFLSGQYGQLSLARLAIWRGDWDQALDLVHQMPYEAFEGRSLDRETLCYSLVLADLHLRQRRPDEALPVLDFVYDAAAVMADWGLLVRVGVLRARLRTDPLAVSFSLEAAYQGAEEAAALAAECGLLTVRIEALALAVRIAFGRQQFEQADRLSDQLISLLAGHTALRWLRMEEVYWALALAKRGRPAAAKWAERARQVRDRRAAALGMATGARLVGYPPY